jgi:hypothetical protein
MAVAFTVLGAPKDLAATDHREDFMRFHRTVLFISCLSVLALACGGGGGSGGSSASTFKVYGSAHKLVGARASLAAVTPFGSPTSTRQVFYKGWVSTSDDCSDPVLLDDLGASGKEIEFFDDPVIFEGSPPDGTYECVIVQVSDTMRIKPDQVAQDAFPGVCAVGTAYDVDTFKTGDPDRAQLGSADLQVGEGTPDAPVPQAVTIFISTDPTKLAATVADSQKVQLLAPMVVPGQTTFFSDFSDRVADNDGHCWLEKGEVGFR